MNPSAASAQPVAPAAPALSPAKGLLALLAIIVLVALFIGLTHVAGVAEFWTGFLFILYWAGFEHVQREKLPHAVVGSLLGLSLAYALHALPPLLGGAGWAIALGALLVAIYCQVMGWLPIAINMATMLFLTVGTIPAVQQHADLAGAFAGLVLGILFMTIIVIGGTWAMQKMAGRSAEKLAEPHP